jgi:hypothetical protein
MDWEDVRPARNGIPIMRRLLLLHHEGKRFYHESGKKKPELLDSIKAG